MLIEVAKIVDTMSSFAANTKDDRMSVIVARVAQRLSHQGEPWEQPLTAKEQRIVDMFSSRIAA
jgi:hypothetical protein